MAVKIIRNIGHILIESVLFNVRQTGSITKMNVKSGLSTGLDLFGSLPTLNAKQVPPSSWRMVIDF